MKAKKTPEIFARFDTLKEHGLTRFVVTVCHKDEAGRWTRGLPRDARPLIEDDGACSLEAYCYLHEDHIGAPEIPSIFSIAYVNAYIVELELATGMATRLKRLNLAMNLMGREEGSARTFGRFANRFARALGAKSFVQFRNETRDWNQDEFVVWDVGDMERDIDRVIADLVKTKCDAITA